MQYLFNNKIFYKAFIYDIKSKIIRMEHSFGIVIQKQMEESKINASRLKLLKKILKDQNIY